MKRAYRHLAARRQLLSVLDRRHPRRPFHHPQCSPRNLHPPRLCQRSPWRIRQGRHHRRIRQEDRPRQNHLATGSLWQTDLGHRLSRPHRRQILQGRRRQLLAVGLGPPLQRPLPLRRHLHHRQERLPQGLVLPGSPPLYHHCLAQSRRQGSLQPALWLGGHSSQ